MRFVASLVPAVTVAAALVVGLMLVPVPAAHAATPRMDAMERAVVRSINRHRASAGLRRMHRYRALGRAADVHSREMLAANYFAHESRNGGSFAARVHRFTRVRRVGETIAMVPRCGRHAVHRVVSMWMHSPPHRAILLSRRLHRVGVARRSGRLGGARACVVTADFAR
jgi:uncharacterized protein YkwD